MTRQEHEALVLSEIHNLFEYREGVLYWKARPLDHFKNSKNRLRWNTRYAGTPVGSPHPTSRYIHTALKIGGFSRRHSVHRLVWVVCHNRWPTNNIDHIDGNRSNNAIYNLRDVTRVENSRNRRVNFNSESGVIGVHRYHKNGKWQARITHNGVTTWLGSFDTVGEAKKARLDAQEKLGFHENHGSRTYVNS